MSSLFLHITLSILNAEIRNCGHLLLDPILQQVKAFLGAWVSVFSAAEEAGLVGDSLARSEEFCLVKWQFQKVPERLLMTKTGVSFLCVS